jgi:hypothetical protein
MQSPHFEGDAYDTHVIEFSELSDFTQSESIRILLYQPSPTWRKFELMNIKFYADLTVKTPNGSGRAASRQNNHGERGLVGLLMADLAVLRDNLNPTS